jgi:hypothetical protein
MKLFDNHDGANGQAKAVLAILQSSNIEDSYNSERCQYMAQPEFERWHNGREQGYVIWFRPNYSRQLNIAFFEHRNSDSICAVKWEQTTMNPPTIDTMEANGTVYKDKWDVSKTVSPYHFSEMAEWIMEQLEAFWKETSNNRTL